MINALEGKNEFFNYYFYELESHKKAKYESIIFKN